MIAVQQPLLDEKPELLFRFLWITKTGPRLRYFSNVHAFAGYVGEVRKLCGALSVEFRTPFLAVSVQP